MVVVDCLSKYAYFMALAHPYTAKIVADIFTTQIMHLHGIPRSMVSDRDPIFLSHFWKNFSNSRELS